MVFTVGQGVAAIVPILLGAIRDLTGSYAGGLIISLGVTAGIGVLGWVISGSAAVHQGKEVDNHGSDVRSLH